MGLCAYIETMRMSTIVNLFRRLSVALHYPPLNLCGCLENLHLASIPSVEQRLPAVYGSYITFSALSLA